MTQEPDHSKYNVFHYNNMHSPSYIPRWFAVTRFHEVEIQQSSSCQKKEGKLYHMAWGRISTMVPWLPSLSSRSWQKKSKGLSKIIILTIMFCWFLTGKMSKGSKWFALHVWKKPLLWPNISYHIYHMWHELTVLDNNSRKNWLQ